MSLLAGPLRACCFRGVIHEGEAKGVFKEIGGWKHYVALPETESTRAIVIFPDVFGVDRVNIQLIADSFAAQGFTTIIPDLFRGKGLAEGDIKPGFDFQSWVVDHPAEAIDQVIATTIKALQTTYKATSIGAIGYCFGGRFVARFAKKSSGIDAGVLCHPSRTSEEEVAAIEVPVSFQCAETDKSFPAASRLKAEELLQGSAARPVYTFTVFSHVEHGFAARGDLTIPQVRFAKEQAFLNAVTFFDAWL